MKRLWILFHPSSKPSLSSGICWLTVFVFSTFAAPGLSKAASNDKIPAELIEFFEKEVRPVLV
ncbi:MAG TPA: hypothetical protein DDZ90_24350, partial [Planctomycetaceae bacterium]|nr:hypothetical protein [Planctomycetaceae bacterium]